MDSTGVETIVESDLYHEYAERYYRHKADEETREKNDLWIKQMQYNYYSMSGYYYTASLNGHGAFSPLKTDSLGVMFGINVAQKPQARSDFENDLAAINAARKKARELKENG